MPGTREVRMWVPVGLLGVGCALLLLAKQQEARPLVAPLESVIPDTLLGYQSRNLAVSAEEQRIAGMSDYLLRLYGGSDSTAYRFSVYIGYYEDQTQGRSIHSPRNCLPGAGWEPITNAPHRVPMGNGTVEVNRYLLGNRNARAVVYYWYQGRGRVAWNEYAVKWDLLRDKATHGRSEEALVRVVVPVREGNEAEADAIATAVAQTIIGPIFHALPTLPGASGPLPGA